MSCSLQCGGSAPYNYKNVSEDDILDLPSATTSGIDTPSPSPGTSPWMQTPGKATPGVEMTPTPSPTPTLAPEKLQKYTDPEYCKSQVENDPELRWLVSTVLGEAATIIKSQWEKGEELTAATAIANTIMNRKASDFGDFAPYYSIEKITEQWYSGRDEKPATAFRAYVIDDMDGFKAISGHDDRYIERTSTPFYNAVMEAVLPVYYGEVDDITKGAVYIFSPQKQIADGSEKPSWATRENRAPVPGLRGYDLELYYQDGFIGRVPMN